MATHWILAFTFALILQVQESQSAAGLGTLEVLFHEFRSDGKGFNGNCCDSIFTWGCHSNPCDPFFVLCLDRQGGSGCGIYHRTTGTIHEANNIDFGNSIGGTPNPMHVVLSTVRQNFEVRVTAMDHDPLNGNDHIRDLAHTVTNLKPGVNGVKGSYRDVHMNSGAVQMYIRVRSYCDVHYYGNTCNTRCVSNEGGFYTCHPQSGAKICSQYYYGSHCNTRCKPNEYGHYSCDGIGNKICHTGWTGDNCINDINECLQEGPCRNNATCLNLDGAYSCVCADGFQGDHCEDTINDCIINPCKNGGTCHVANTSGFSCSCLPWWGGDTCEDHIDPCDVTPCYNNATCVFNNSTIGGFTCHCSSHWTGETCDIELTTTTTNTPGTTSTVFQTTTRVPFSGEPYSIVLEGIIDDTNHQALDTGLKFLVKELGGLADVITVKTNVTIVPIAEGIITSAVTFYTDRNDDAIEVDVIDTIFNTNSDETINSYLPLPLYRPRPEANIQENWFNDNWYAVVLPALFAITLVTCLAAVLVHTKRKRAERNFTENVQHSTKPRSFGNTTYGVGFDRHQDDFIKVKPLTLDGKDNCRELPKIHDYTKLAQLSGPRLYETMLKGGKVPSSGTAPYMHMASLVGRGETTPNAYTSFSNLSLRRTEDNHYQEIDDVIAEKLAQDLELDVQDNGADNDSNVSADYIDISDVTRDYNDVSDVTADYTDISSLSSMEEVIEGGEKSKCDESLA